VANYLFRVADDAAAIFSENCKLLLLYLEFTQFITECGEQLLTSLVKSAN
jgi:hypothetical protein